MANLYGFDQAGTKRIVDVVRQIERAPVNPRPRQVAPLGRGEETFIVEGELDGALATGGVTSPSTATLSVFRFNSSGSYIDTGINVTVTNRSDTFSAESGDFLVAGILADEWRPFGAAGGAEGDGLSGDVKEVTTAYTVTDSDYYILGDPDGGSFSITLPTSGISEGRTIKVRNIGALALRSVSVVGQLTLTASSSSALGPGSSTQVIFDPGETSLGAVWWFA